jgi:hypothetical protein
VLDAAFGVIIVNACGHCSFLERRKQILDLSLDTVFGERVCSRWSQKACIGLLAVLCAMSEIACPIYMTCMCMTCMCIMCYHVVCLDIYPLACACADMVGVQYYCVVSCLLISIVVFDICKCVLAAFDLASCAMLLYALE